MKHTDKFIEKLWDKLSNIPITDDDLIDKKFYIFPRYSDKIEVVWRWFDNNHSKGIKHLLHLK